MCDSTTSDVASTGTAGKTLDRIECAPRQPTEPQMAQWVAAYRLPSAAIEVLANVRQKTLASGRPCL